MKKLKRRFYYIIYRLLRTDMVARMRVQGCTWARINTVLKPLGQKQILAVQRKGRGAILTFGWPPNDFRNSDLNY